MRATGSDQHWYAVAILTEQGYARIFADGIQTTGFLRPLLKLGNFAAQNRQPSGAALDRKPLPAGFWATIARRLYARRKQRSSIDDNSEAKRGRLHRYANRMDQMIEERDPMNLYEFYLQMLKELDTA